VISAPGHYLVTRDITASSAPGDGVLRITSPDVVLDLNGHTITASGNAAIYIEPPLSTPGSIEIRNGQVRGGALGITHPNDIPGSTYAVRLRFERLDVSAQSFVALLVHGAPVVEVVSCAFRGSGLGSAVQIHKGHLPRWTGLLRDNRVSDIGGDGIELTGMSGGLVRDNVVSNFGTAGGAIMADGISLITSEGVRVQGNAIHAPNVSATTTGLMLNDTHRTLATDNVITANLDSGINVGGNGNVLTGNLVGGTTFDGVSVFGNGNTLTRNTVQSGSSGVRISGANNLIDANTIEGHSGVGLTFVAGAVNNAYRGNMLRNNTGGAVSGTATDAGGNIP
jgi:parallel beta-helix repeat protein